MLIAVVVAYCLLILPLNVRVFLYFNSNDKKLYFTFNLFTITLIGGYLGLNKKGANINLASGKKILLPIKKLIGLKSSIKPLKDYKIFSIKSYIKIGDCENNALIFGGVSMINTILILINFGYLQNKSRKILSNNIVYDKKTTGLNLNIKINLFINLLMVFISLSKLFVRKIFNGNKT